MINLQQISGSHRLRISGRINMHPKGLFSNNIHQLRRRNCSRECASCETRVRRLLIRKRKTDQRKLRERRPEEGQPNGHARCGIHRQRTRGTGDDRLVVWVEP